jgi:methyl-accepting chemotaxis protein
LQAWWWAALTVCALIALATSLSQRRMLEDRTVQMHTAVDLVYGLAQTLQDDVTAGKMTLADAKTQLRERARRMTFNKGQGYAVLYNADTSLLLNGSNPALDGKITNATDANGVVIANAQIDAARQSPEGGIASYL